MWFICPSGCAVEIGVLTYGRKGPVVVGSSWLCDRAGEVGVWLCRRSNSVVLERVVCVLSRLCDPSFCAVEVGVWWCDRSDYVVVLSS